MTQRIVLPPDGVLIIGAGLAGLFLALKLKRPSLVLSPAPLGEAAASAWAQGGLAVALGAQDSPTLHAADTLAAGGGLVDPVVAALIADDGPDRVRDLLALGVPFDRTPDGALVASLEAAHSRPRVVRVGGDLAGRAIMEALAAAVAATPRIRVVTGLRARALMQTEAGRAAGVLARDGGGDPVEILAGEVVLATGGIGGLYQVTTNPAGALGDGLALAAAAGALIADPEFVQFHPTAIDIGRDPAPLATEALRGEGARLVDQRGAPFMAAFDPRGDLAPRDVVARAIHSQREAGLGAFLDARAAVGDHFPEAFPTVFAACMAAGLDPRATPIPVAPAAHYHMGGIVTDLWGQTTLEGVSAVGECASTGAHGANRLASNSLLEAVVFAARIAVRLDGSTSPVSGARALGATLGATLGAADLPAAELKTLRKMMAAELGVARDEAGMGRLRVWLDEALARRGPLGELLAARFVLEGALRRRESRGAHFRTDHPDLAAEARRTFLTRADLSLPGAP